MDSEIIDFLGFKVFDVSNNKKNGILEFLGIQDYNLKKQTGCFIIRVV